DRHGRQQHGGGESKPKPASGFHDVIFVWNTLAPKQTMPPLSVAHRIAPSVDHATPIFVLLAQKEITSLTLRSATGSLSPSHNQRTTTKSGWLSCGPGST